MRRFAILWVLFSLVFWFLADRVQAERPPEFRDKAMLVVSGTVKTIASKNSPYLDTDSHVRLGTLTEYTAEIVVESVEKGEKVRVGDTIKVYWFHVTKLSGKAFGGAVGHGYPLKKASRAKFWLMERKDYWAIIYNKDGVEIIKKK
jgi:hypothetical protein